MRLVPHLVATTHLVGLKPEAVLGTSGNGTFGRQVHEKLELVFHTGGIAERTRPFFALTGLLPSEPLQQIVNMSQSDRRDSIAVHGLLPDLSPMAATGDASRAAESHLE